MNEDINFILKVVRNGLILGGMYFISEFAYHNIIDFTVMKPILVFFGMYVLTEVGRYYKLNISQIPSTKIKSIIFA